MSAAIRLSRILIVSAIVALIASANPAVATIHTINVSNTQFNPANKQIVHGDTVRWVLVNGTHTCTADPLSPKDWDSGTLTSTPFQVVFRAEDGNGPFPYHCDVHAGMKGTITIQTLEATREETDVLPTEFSLEQNFPNPFNPTTTIRFTVDRAIRVDMSVFNVLGESIDYEDLGILAPGSYVVEWNGNQTGHTNLSTGVYFYRLRAGDQVITRKMVLLK